MLLSFEMENWRAFKDPTTFSMMASRERRRSDGLSVLAPMYQNAKVLPAAAVFGPNASGKTALFEAIDFVRHMVVNGLPVNRRIPVDPYRLDSESRNRPCRFRFELLVDELIYYYEVELNDMCVLRESLSIKRTRKTDLVFSRMGSEYQFGKPYQNERHRFIAEGTRDNQLFLHNAVAQNARQFEPVFNWFAKSLTVIGVDAHYENYSKMLVRNDFKKYISDQLRKYNTGIDSIELIEIPVDSIPMLSPELLQDFIAEVPHGEEASIQLRINKKGCDIYIIHIKDGKPRASKVQPIHHDMDGKGVHFDLSEESKGTQRLIELLPLFFDFASTAGSAESKVYLVDELDRSFHSELAISLLSNFVEACDASSRKQLVFSTHNLELMEEGPLRRDELWVCDKHPQTGTATLTCIGRHKEARKDADLLKRYKANRFGGYPQFE